MESIVEKPYLKSLCIDEKVFYAKELTKVKGLDETSKI
jgi:hypothetical protein